MNVVVLTKHVPNPTGSPPEIGPDFRLRREAVEGALDPIDEHALAAAYALAGRGTGSLTAISMGPERATAAVRRALAMGVQHGILISDDSLAGVDALGTALVLAAAIKRQPFDLVIAGVESSDGATGAMPMTLAELLGIPSATFARRIEVRDGTVCTERQTHAGYDVIECTLPALVTVMAGVAERRNVSVREMIQAKRKPIEQLALADLGLGADHVRPFQEVVAIEFGQEREAGEVVEDPREAPARMVRLLREAEVI